VIGIHSDTRERYPDGMPDTESETPTPRRFPIRLPRPLWIALAGGVILGIVIAVIWGQPISDAILENKVLVRRFAMRSDSELEIWRDWASDSPTATYWYSIKKDGQVRNEYIVFARVAWQSINGVDVQFLQFDQSDVAAVVDCSVTRDASSPQLIRTVS
jgi:hypothetical protein